MRGIEEVYNTILDEETAVKKSESKTNNEIFELLMQIMDKLSKNDEETNEVEVEVEDKEGD